MTRELNCYLLRTGISRVVKQRGKVPRRFFDIRCIEQGRDHGQHIRSRVNQRSGVVQRYAANGDDRYL